MNPELLQLLVCPETHQRVEPMDSDSLEALNRRIHSGSLRNVAGQPVTEAVEGALVREDGRVAYPVRGGIPIMLVEEGLLLEPSEGRS